LAREWLEQTASSLGGSLAAPALTCCFGQMQTPGFCTQLAGQREGATVPVAARQASRRVRASGTIEGCVSRAGIVVRLYPVAFSLFNTAPGPAGGTRVTCSQLLSVARP
jgi:hypothetical protein